MADLTPFAIKDPNEIVTYTFQWSDELASGETLSTVSWPAPTGLTESAAGSISGTTTSVRFSDGTEGALYEAPCRVTTNQTNTYEKTLWILVETK